VLDRASSFAHPEVVALLKSKFVPVAIDQAYQRRQKDEEGDFYRKIAGQGPRNDFSGRTTQGFYAATNSGELLFYNNNRNPDRLVNHLKQALAKAESKPGKVEPISEEVSPDKRFNPDLPEGGLVLRVHARVLGGYEEASDEWLKIFQSSLSRDNLWITSAEHEALVRGEVPEKLQRRIARYHLVDNTRGEPPMWKPEEIKSIDLKLKSGVLTGTAELKSANGEREFKADFYGGIKSENGKITQFDVVAKGQFRGHGRYTKNPPPGHFPLGISFTLADGSNVADEIPPQGSRGWIDGYLR
jgi:hypothetical protein